MERQSGQNNVELTFYLKNIFKIGNSCNKFSPGIVVKWLRKFFLGFIRN